jgi:hypothetical protein
LRATTDSDGTYRFDHNAPIRHSIEVDEGTLPEPAGGGEYVLTTGREIYNLNVPMGFTAPNVNFGYVAVDVPADAGAVSASGSTDPGGSNSDQDGGQRNPFEDPDPETEELYPQPDPLPEDAPTATVPREGTWVVYNQAGNMSCAGGLALSLDALPPENGTIEVLEDGALSMTGGMAEVTSLTATPNPDVLGLYTASTGVQNVTIDFYFQVVTAEHIIGYLLGTASEQGVTCDVYRPFTMDYGG